MKQTEQEVLRDFWRRWIQNDPDISRVQRSVGTTHVKMNGGVLCIAFHGRARKE